MRRIMRDIRRGFRFWGIGWPCIAAPVLIAWAVLEADRRVRER